MKYTGIWIDHEKAFIVTEYVEKTDIGTLQKTKEEFCSINSDIERPGHLSPGQRVGPAPYTARDSVNEHGEGGHRAQQLHRFYEDVLDHVKDANKIFIFGPGNAKNEIKHVFEHNNQQAAKLDAIETTDSLTQSQIKLKVRSHFHLSEPRYGGKN